MNKISYLIVLFLISLIIWSIYLEVSVGKVFFRPNFVLFGFTNFFRGPFLKDNEFLWNPSYWDINPYITLPVIMIILHFVYTRIIRK
jgi:hypothetical protein